MIPILTPSSTADDAALRAKVDEAMSVYDEYVKNKDDDEKAPEADPKKEEA